MEEKLEAPQLLIKGNQVQIEYNGIDTHKLRYAPKNNSTGTGAAWGDFRTPGTFPQSKHARSYCDIDKKTYVDRDRVNRSEVSTWSVAEAAAHCKLQCGSEAAPA